MESNNIINGNCWVACFDIIGFKNLLNDFMTQAKINEEIAPAMDAFVEVYYKDILRSLEEKGQYWPDRVLIHWFSDTFLLYTFDDSRESLCCIQESATHFFVDVIWTKMPLRGALSIGPFYADKDNGIFLGRALMDAYQYADKQHWIGLVITPTGRTKSQKFGLCPPDRATYTEYNVPVKSKEKSIKTDTEKLFSFKMQEYPHVEESIVEIQKEAQNKFDKSEYDTIKDIYENTLRFIRDTR